MDIIFSLHDPNYFCEYTGQKWGPFDYVWRKYFTLVLFEMWLNFSMLALRAFESSLACWSDSELSRVSRLLQCLAKVRRHIICAAKRPPPTHQTRDTRCAPRVSCVGGVPQRAKAQLKCGWSATDNNTDATEVEGATIVFPHKLCIFELFLDTVLLLLDCLSCLSGFDPSGVEIPVWVIPPVTVPESNTFLEAI